MSHAHIENYNFARFKTFVASQNLDDLVNQPVVLVLGRLGAGKSTTISIQLGAKYRSDNDGTLRLESSSAATPSTSHGFTSKTTNVSLYRDGVTGLQYVDTAGLNENRGFEEKLWTGWCSSLILSIVAQIQSVLLVIDYGEIKSVRASGVRSLAEYVSSNIVGTSRASRPFYKNMIFVFSHCRNKIGDRIGKDALLKDLKQIRDEEDAKLEGKLQSLSFQYPSNEATQETATATRVSEMAIEWNRVAKETQDDVRLSRATLLLLDTITDAPERCFLSFPCNAMDCEKQHLQLSELIQKCTGISRYELQAIVKERKVNGLEMWRILAHVCTTPCPSLGGRSFASFLKNKARLLEGLVSVIERNKNLLKQVSEDWESLRQELRDDKQRQLEKLRTDRKKAEKDQHYLKQSRDIALSERIQRKKARSSGWKSWWIWGGGWAAETYEKNDPEPFVQVQYEWPMTPREPQGTISERMCNGANGQLRVELTSCKGYDLHVDIKLFRHQKDLPETAQRIRLLGETIADCDRTAKTLDQDLKALDTVQSKEELANWLLKEKHQREVQLVDIQGQLAEETIDYQTEVVPSEGQVLEGLVRLLKMLQACVLDMLARDLPATVKHTLDEFLQAYATADNKQAELSEDSIARSLVPCQISNPRIPHMDRDEDMPAFDCGNQDGPTEFCLVAIGVSSYKFGNLPNACHDAEFVANAFQNLGYSVNLWLDVSTTLDINHLLQTLREDVNERTSAIVVYFAGHAVQRYDGSIHLLFGDASQLTDASEEHCIAAQDLRAQVLQLPIAEDAVALFLFDCCRDVPEGAQENVGQAARPDPPRRRLERVAATIWSCPFGGTALDGDKHEGNGPFVKALVAELGSYDLTVPELYENIYRSVSSYARNKTRGLSTQRVSFQQQGSLLKKRGLFCESRARAKRVKVHDPRSKAQLLRSLEDAVSHR